MIELIVPALALAKSIIDAVNAHAAGEATDEQLVMLRRISEAKVAAAVDSIDAALKRGGHDA